MIQPPKKDCQPQEEFAAGSIAASDSAANYCKKFELAFCMREAFSDHANFSFPVCLQ